MRSVNPHPVISEKALGLSEGGTYVFEVQMNANKIEIKRAVEELFQVSVRRVRTTVSKGREIRRRTRKTSVAGRTSDQKRAYVTLIEGQKISIFEEK
jgi:large subunit ribosomal protein L23